MYIENGNFSLWCDFVERDFLQTGLKKLIENNIVNGATSNPAIFKNAFLSSKAYKEDIERLKGKPAKEIYETLAIKDIQISADLLKNLYDNEDDGFISIEVDPALCDDAQATIAEGERLFATINRPNVMIKVPATKAGYQAMEILMSKGINVNATLIFSPQQANACLKAFANANKKLTNTQKLPQAVISIFVSRFDRKMDTILNQKGIATAKLGIYNATRIYHDITSSNLPNVRTLFASTGVKGDDLPKAYYITELLYPNAINTAPLDTIDAFISTGIKKIQNPIDKATIDQFFDDLRNKEINLDVIYHDLLHEGIDAFKIAFREILDVLEKG